MGPTRISRESLAAQVYLRSLSAAVSNLTGKTRAIPAVSRYNTADHPKGGSPAVRTGYCLNDNHRRHTLAGHPEHAGRLERIARQLQESGLASELVRIPTEAAPRAALERVHRPEYIDHLQAMCQRAGYLDPDTYVQPGSWEAALHAAGGLLALVREVLSGRLDNGFALVRPPGHHAEADRAMGFCLLNNVAIAARAAQAEWGVERVLIIDWDVHHGNGTQHTFYEDPSVMYFSIHQYPYYPGTGAADEQGRGPGEGTTVNVPLPGGAGDDGYLYAFERLLVPLARRFQPDFILVSAGYDPHWRDPLAAMEVTLTGFTRMTQIVHELAKELCHGRVVLTLEGGYDLEALAYGVVNSLYVLSGQSHKATDPLGRGPMAVRDVRRIVDELCALWDV